MIWLAIIGEDEGETHVEFEGHQTLENAQNEMNEIYGRLRVDGKQPYPYYIYESDVPLYGHHAYTLDDMDFNFYKEPDESQKEILKDIEAKIEKAIESGNEDELLEVIGKLKDE